MIGSYPTNPSSRTINPQFSNPSQGHSTNSYHHTTGSRFPVHFYLRQVSLMLTSLSVPVDLSLDLGGLDLVTRDALSSFLCERCTDYTFCLDLFNDHAIVPAVDLHNNRQGVARTHLLNGKFIPSSTAPHCQLFAREVLSTIELSHLLCALLLGAYRQDL